MQDSKRDRDVKNRLLDYVGEGEGGMVWKKSIETCILPYVKQMPSASSMHEAGWGDTWAPVSDSCQYMAKPTTIL